jgi:endonuclease/exonuclease/phosphatase (EEP) superfamily protein YafD
MPSKKPRAFIFVSVLNLLLLVLLWLIDERFAEHNWWITILAYVPQHPFALLTVALLLWAIVRHNARAALLQLPALVLLLVYFFGLNIPFGSGHTVQNGVSLRVMSYNLFGKTATSAVIKSVNADIICLQESRDQKLLQNLQQALPNYFVAHEGEITIFSRYPIRGSKVQHLSRSWRTILEVDVDVGGILVRIVSVHFNTLNIQGGNYYLTHPQTTPKRVTDSIADRLEATQKLLEIAKRTNIPLLVTGDFNTPSRGHLYGTLKQELEDAFAATGWGFGYTYRSDLPLLRIDYIWTNRLIKATRAFNPDTRASDHRPLVAEVLVNRPTP